MSKRLFKQIVISFFTSIFLFVFLFSVFKLLSIEKQPFDQRKADISKLKPLEYEPSAFWVKQGERIFVYSRVLNPNEQWGLKNFEYSFSLVSQEGENQVATHVVDGEDYILPNQTKYIISVFPDSKVSFDLVAFNTKVNQNFWEKLDNEEFLKADLFSITNVDLKMGSGQVTATTQTQSSVFYEFKKDLKRGDTGEDVFNLQSVLSKDSTIYPEGVINSTFDLATYKAVIRFQNMAGISPQTGIVDYKTREVLNKMFASSKSQSIQQSSGVTFNDNLKFGDKGSEVRELQRILAMDPSVYPEARINGNFDYLLKRALERFQEKHSLSKTGEFDTPTRTKLNSVLNASENTNQILQGLTAELAFTVFNNSNTSFGEVELVGFLCNSQNSVVAISKSIVNLEAQKNRRASFSWEHAIDKNVNVCPGGLQAYTNVFDNNNIIK